MDWYEQEVRALERQFAASSRPASPAVFYGSSSIRMWETLSADLGWPVVNAGFGGSTLEACVHFFDRIVTPLRPGSLVVYAGDNDLGDGRTPDDVLRYFRALLAKIDAALDGVPFGYISIKPSPARWGILDAIRRTNAGIRDQMGRRTGAVYVDVFGAMIGSRGEPRPELFLDDGLHLSREGYRNWSQAIRPYRNRFFMESSSPENSPRL